MASVGELHDAVGRGDIDAVREALMENGADARARDLAVSQSYAGADNGRRARQSRNCGHHSGRGGRRQPAGESFEPEGPLTRAVQNDEPETLGRSAGCWLRPERRHGPAPCRMRLLRVISRTRPLRQRCSPKRPTARCRSTRSGRAGSWRRKCSIRRRAGRHGDPADGTGANRLAARR